MSRATFDVPAIPGLWDRGRPTWASVQRSGGPERVVTDEPAPDFVPRPVGFTAGGTFPYDEPIAEPEPCWCGGRMKISSISVRAFSTTVTLKCPDHVGVEPQLWEGDQA